MPERTFSSKDYRYGFNGKEKDEDEEWGSLTHYDYGFRIYNPGVGRFLSVDPLTKEFPFYTPYQFAGNSPIANIDLDGAEKYHYILIENSHTCVMKPFYLGVEEKKPSFWQTFFNTAHWKDHSGYEWEREMHWLMTAPGEHYAFDTFDQMLGFIDAYSRGEIIQMSQENKALEALGMALIEISPILVQIDPSDPDGIGMPITSGSSRFSRTNSRTVNGVKTGVKNKRVGVFGKGVEEASIDDLIFWHPVPRPNVPEGHIESLAKSIKADGFMVDDAINVVEFPGGQRIIWDGMHRTSAMKNLGEKTIPAKIWKWKDFTGAEKKSALDTPLLGDLIKSFTN